jgi:hypothetical protein
MQPSQGPPLVLRETWQVEVVGSRIVRAGLVGAVKWAAQEAKAIAGSTPFRLQVRIVAQHTHSHAALTAHGRVAGLIERLQLVAVACACCGVRHGLCMSSDSTVLSLNSTQ